MLSFLPLLLILKPTNLMVPEIVVMESFRVLTFTILALSLSVTAEDSSESGGMLCVSKCGTCPVICSESPPPSPSQIYIIPGSPPPPPPSPPPPPPISSSQPSPPGGEESRGGLSYPYYYFYTADAPPQLLVSAGLWLFLTLVYFVDLV